MVNNQNTRALFVQNAVAFVRQHGFDGFDLDWEYPGQRGGAATDRV
jgi:chitinase